MNTILTSKGQITLPKELREELGLCAGDRVDFFVEEDQSVRMVIKHVPVSSLKGMLPSPEQPVSIQEMDKAIQEGVEKP